MAPWLAEHLPQPGPVSAPHCASRPDQPAPRPPSDPSLFGTQSPSCAGVMLSNVGGSFAHFVYLGCRPRVQAWGPPCPPRGAPHCFMQNWQPGGVAAGRDSPPVGRPQGPLCRRLCLPRSLPELPGSVPPFLPGGQPGPCLPGDGALGLRRVTRDDAFRLLASAPLPPLLSPLWGLALAGSHSVRRDPHPEGLTPVPGRVSLVTRVQ